MAKFVFEDLTLSEPDEVFGGGVIRTEYQITYPAFDDAATEGVKVTVFLPYDLSKSVQSIKEEGYGQIRRLLEKALSDLD